MYNRNFSRRQSRLELKVIESRLHPNPVINGATIMHEHRGRNIWFQAWRGDNPVTPRQWLKASRDYVLVTPDFYKECAEDFLELAGSDSE